MKSITIATPYYNYLTQEYFESFYRTLMSGEIKFNLVQLQGTLIHVARNKIAMGIKTDFILFVDSDMVWEPDDILKLLRDDKDIIGGLYFLKKPLFHPIAYKNEEPVSNYPDYPFEVDSIGTGFLLIKKEVFESLLDDVFVEKFGLPFDPIPAQNSQVYKRTGLHGIIDDVAFCARAKSRGFEVWCDPTLNIGHIGTTIYWTQEMRKYWEEIHKNEAPESTQVE